MMIENVMIDEGREAPTGEGKDLTIALVSFPFYTRCHKHHAFDGESAHTRSYAYFTLPHN